MTTLDIIDDVLRREGGFVNDPADRGGATKYGITARTLGEYRRLSRPATREEVLALDESEARAIYFTRYVEQPGFKAVADDELRAQLVDDGVLAGPATVITSLQQLLRVPADGVLGPTTLRALEAVDIGTLRRALVRDRLLRFARLVQAKPEQVKFLAGWVDRALVFLV